MLPTIMLGFVVLLMGVFILLSLLHKNDEQSNDGTLLSDEEIKKMKKKTTSS